MQDAGLSHRIDDLVALDRHSVRLESDVYDGSRDIPIGQSRLGGEPDLPSAERWPDWRGKPLAFIAQIALDEMPQVSDQSMPDAGLLSFFYDAEQEVWGFDPADRGAWRILWSAPDVSLERRPWPDGVPEHARYQPCRLTGTLEVTHVSVEASEIERLEMTRDEWIAYADVVEDDDANPIHRFLGDPENVQGDMQLECQLVANGLYCGDTSGYDDPRADELRPGASEWRLLLQVDSDDRAQMMWGDVGRLYYWLPREAIDHGDWGSAWMILQCS